MGKSHLEHLCQVKRMNEMNDSRSPITDFYANKSILVTGATGFIGKVSYVRQASSLAQPLEPLSLRHIRH